MSLVIAMHSNEFSIIAADKRTVFAIDAQIVHKNDDSEKIYKTGLGLITGCGYIELLDAVKHRIANTPITNTDQIVDIIINERKAISFWLDAMQKTIIS